MADRLTARRALATGTATVVLLVGCGSTPDAEQQTALRDHNDGQAPGGDSIAPTDPGGRIDGSVDAGSTGAEQKVPAPPDASSGEVAPAEPTEGDPALWPGDGPLPSDAPELIAELDRAESALRASGVGDPSRNAVTAAWGRRQQLLYRVLADHPEWVDQVVHGVKPSVRNAVVANASAQDELLDLVRSAELSTTVPAWRIVEPAPAAELLAHYQEAEALTGVPWAILAAINLVESRMGRIEGVSTAGAVGPMQFLPSTWAECCDGDPGDDRDAIIGAATYLADRGASEDLDRALLGYNNSHHYVAAIRSYAAVMEENERAYHGYHAWEVLYLSEAGLLHLPVGYEEAEPVDASAWSAANPELVVLAPNALR